MIACDAGLDEIKEGKYRKRSGLSIIYIYILLLNLFMFEANLVKGFFWKGVTFKEMLRMFDGKLQTCQTDRMVNGNHANR